MSHATQAIPDIKRCRFDGALQYATVFTGGPAGAFLLRSRVEVKRQMYRGLRCSQCDTVTEIAELSKPREKAPQPEVRLSIVNAIKQLKRAGNKFPWEV
jgi:hypothetical protein